MIYFSVLIFNALSQFKTHNNHLSSNLILLGEDDADDREFFEEVLSTLETTYQLIALNNGNKVISWIKNLHTSELPCLIILDYNLPQLNGAEILKVLNADERLKPIPKIVWSTSNSSVYKSMCLQLGATDYIVKPSNIDTLKEITRYMLSFCSS